MDGCGGTTFLANLAASPNHIFAIRAAQELSAASSFLPLVRPEQIPSQAAQAKNTRPKSHRCKRDLFELLLRVLSPSN